MIRLYYVPEINQFHPHSEFGVQFSKQHPRERGNRQRWVRVCEQGLAFMERALSVAFEKPGVSDDDLGDAILKFYRVRECLETEGASEGWPALLALPWDREIPGMERFWSKLH